MMFAASNSVCYKEEWSMDCSEASKSTNQVGAQSYASVSCCFPGDSLNSTLR